MKKNIFIAALITLSLAAVALFLCFWLGGPEDTWICVNNQWVKHGNPGSAMPQSGCGQELKIGLDQDCSDNGGQWLENFRECENVSLEWCEQVGGNFAECESACRHNPGAEVCTMQCVPVCYFNAGRTNNNIAAKPEEKIGYIKKIYERDGKNYLDFDEVQWLTGTEGTCLPELSPRSDIPPCNPNGFYILNSDAEIKSYAISGQVIVQTLTDGMIGGIELETKDLAGLRNLSQEQFKIYPFRLTIINSEAVKITEQYLP